MSDLTQIELRRMLNYDPITGEFTWQCRDDRAPSWNARWSGKRAGGAKERRHTSYRVIVINLRPYYAHRLAWFWMTGTWPSEVDHRDGDGSNNAWENLREVTRSQNNANRRHLQNATGYPGVRRLPNGRFRARVQYGGKARHLGCFDTADEAHRVRAAAARQLFGE